MTAKKEFGNLSVASTGSKYVLAFLNPLFLVSHELVVADFTPSNPMVAGNVVALLSPLVFVPVLTYAFGPQNYDYKSMAEIRLGNDEGIAAAANTDLEQIPGGNGTSVADTESEQKQLRRASLIAKSLTVFMTLALLILWPMPLYGTGYIFSKKFFTGWVSVGILWLFCSSFCVGLFPLWEGRHSMAGTFKGIVRDLMRKGGAKNIRGRAIEESEGSTSPVEGSEKVPEVIMEKTE